MTRWQSAAFGRRMAGLAALLGLALMTMALSGRTPIAGGTTLGAGSDLCPPGSYLFSDEDGSPTPDDNGRVAVEYPAAALADVEVVDGIDIDSVFLRSADLIAVYGQGPFAGMSVTNRAGVKLPIDAVKVCYRDPHPKPTHASSTTKPPTTKPSTTTVPSTKPSTTTVPSTKPSTTTVPSTMPSTTTVPSTMPSTTTVPDTTTSAATTVPDTTNSAPTTSIPNPSTSTAGTPPTTEGQAPPISVLPVVIQSDAPRPEALPMTGVDLTLLIAGGMMVAASGGLAVMARDARSPHVPALLLGRPGRHSRRRRRLRSAGRHR